MRLAHDIRQFPEIEAGMSAKLGIFRGDDGTLKVVGDLCQRNPDLLHRSTGQPMLQHYRRNWRIDEAENDEQHKQQADKGHAGDNQKPATEVKRVNKTTDCES